MNIKDSIKILRRKFEQKNLLFISGNVYDKYIKYVDQGPKRELIGITDIILEQAKEIGYDSILYFRPEQGVRDLLDKKEPTSMSADEFFKKTTKDLETAERGQVFIIDLADIYFSSKNTNTDYESIAKMISSITAKNVDKAVKIIDPSKNHKLIFIMRDHGNIVKDLSYKNNEFGQVSIAYPDRKERSEFLQIFARTIGTTDADDLKIESSDIHKEATSITSGMSYKEILQLGRISEDDLTFKQLINLVKFNNVQSEWEKLPLTDVKNVSKILSKDVKGQGFAIENVERVLKNSLLGLNGAMNGHNNKKPKGILFFAGPTGVGKTELAKSLTKFVFGDVNRMIRFDMSEFSQEHSDQRLIGAPPGYVGYDGGGELTNAVRDEPQSIILFDEIEKAHPRILDKFLQILEDGRLTSSQGELVDFSETFIFFTSNIGADKASAKNDDIKNRSEFIKAVERKFNEMERPEILNRIGINNVVPFNFIKSKEVLISIFESKLGKLTNTVFEKHNINIKLENESKEEILEIVLEEYNPINGGRGLINAMEKTIQTELSTFLFSNIELIGNKTDQVKNILMTTKKGKIIFTEIK